MNTLPATTSTVITTTSATTPIYYDYEYDYGYTVIPEEPQKWLPLTITPTQDQINKLNNIISKNTEKTNDMESNACKNLISKKEINFDILYPTITKIKIIPGGKVTIVTFNDNTQEKVVRDDYDDYNLETALLFALAKKMYRKTLTWEGIEFMATQGLRYYKNVTKMIEKAIKNYYKEEKKEKELLEKEKEKKEIQKRKREKKIAYKKRRHQKN